MAQRARRNPRTAAADRCCAVYSVYKLTVQWKIHAGWAFPTPIISPRDHAGIHGAGSGDEREADGRCGERVAPITLSAQGWYIAVRRPDLSWAGTCTVERAELFPRWLCRLGEHGCRHAPLKSFHAVYKMFQGQPALMTSPWTASCRRRLEVDSAPP